MVIYLDLVMLLNFLVDFFLLLGTNRLSGFPSQPWKCTGAALLGALYSGACLLPGMGFLGNILWRSICLGLMGTVAFGWNPAALKRTGIFLLLTMAMGGVSLRLGRGDFLSVVLCAGICLLLSAVSFGGKIGGREYVPLEISLEDKTANLIALKDTGNTLRDPVTGEPVLVIGKDIASRLTGLTEEQLRNPMETLAARPLSGLRLIPYHSIGNGGSFLLAKRFSEVTIGGVRKSALVAFASEGLGNGEFYQALTGG